MTQYIPIRLSHLLRHCSVGAIVRGPDYLMTVKDIREWKDASGSVTSRRIPYVDQVRSALGIEKELREPPIAKQLDNGQIEGFFIPAMRFPSWMRCPGCSLLYYKPWLGLQEGRKPHCTEPDGKRCPRHPALEQVAWVLVCPDGRMSDVPWHSLAHKSASTRERRQCRADWQEPCLLLKEGQGSMREIRCRRCGAAGAFVNDSRIPFLHARPQPWIKSASGGSNQADLQNDPSELPQIIEINDARVHSAVNQNALVIPPESRIRKGTVVDQLYRSSQKRRRIDQARNAFARRAAFKSLASEFRCSVEDIENAWKDIGNGYPLYGLETTPGLLLESEYRALLEELPDVFDDEDFVTRHFTDAWKSLAADLPKDPKIRSAAGSVDRLVAVNRLKEIQVFMGFRRVNGELVPPDIVDRSDWLPAIELYGEGIFFTVDENILHGWEKQPELMERAKISRTRYERSLIPANPWERQSSVSVIPRFLLMHTLSHLLIRRLESEAGYPAASLKERIYCSVGKEPMSGILIYVAVPDIVGSLGGLVELAEPRRFLRLLSGVFDHAQWCSLDPVCAEHEGQGPQLLNRAACHACSLIPEPGCAYGNVLLDRVFIKGEPASGIPAFLDCVELNR